MTNPKADFFSAFVVFLNFFVEYALSCKLLGLRFVLSIGYDYYQAVCYKASTLLFY